MLDRPVLKVGLRQLFLDLMPCDLGPNNRRGNFLSSVHLFLLESFVFHWTLNQHILRLINLLAIAAILPTLDNNLTSIERLDSFLLAVLVRVAHRTRPKVIRVQVDVGFN